MDYLIQQTNDNDSKFQLMTVHIKFHYLCEDNLHSFRTDSSEINPALDLSNEAL